MSAPASSDPFTVVDASIHTLTEVLTRQHLTGAVPPSLIRVRVLDDGLEVGTRPLDDDHPSIWLTGHRVDDDTDAIGVITGGRVFSLDDPSATLGRTSVGVIVSRRGEVASTTIQDTGEVNSGGDLTGLVVDLLRRAIGVPTPPAPCGPHVLFAQSWLMAIVAFARDEDRIPSWAEIVRLHPAVDLLDPGDDDVVNERELRRILADFADVLSWPLLRGLLDDGRLAVPGLNRGEGAWFDDGSFARRLLVDRPPLRHLRRDVQALLPVRLGQRVAATLDASGVPHTCWPDPLDDLCESA